MTYHAKLTQLGRRQTYTQKVAATMNWYRRCVMGLIELVKFNSGYFIRRAPEFDEMSLERKKMLDLIDRDKQLAMDALKNLIADIEAFQKLPITLADEQKGKLPKRRIKIADGG
jgi:hypothetical protein